MKPQFFRLILLFTFVLSFTFFASAQTEREKGIELYKQGKDKEAIDSLKTALKKYKNDAEVLNYLGLAYLNTNDVKTARKTLEKAVSLSPQNSAIRANLAYIYLLTRKIDKSQSEIEKAIQLDPKNTNAYYIRGTTYLWERKFDKAIPDAEKAIELNKDFAEAYILKSDALLYTFGKEWSEENEPIKVLHLLENAVSALKNCSGNCLDQKSSEFIKERLETVQAFFDYFNQKKEISENLTDPTTTEVTPIKFTSKLPPSYTDKARQAGEKGNVILAILFGADGQIKNIIVLKALNYGLTEQSIIAARKIVFEPEKHNGKPVAVVKRVVYSFDVY